MHRGAWLYETLNFENDKWVDVTYLLIKELFYLVWFFTLRRKWGEGGIKVYIFLESSGSCSSKSN